MRAIFARAIAWFRSMPVPQQALIGIGVPAVAGAAIIGNVRAKGEGGDAGSEVGRGAQGLTAPTTAGIEIPFGGGLDDLFGLQTALANVETTLTRRIEAIRQGPPVDGGQSTSSTAGVTTTQVVNRSIPTETPPTTRAVVKAPTVRNAAASRASVGSTIIPPAATRGQDDLMRRAQRSVPTVSRPAPVSQTRAAPSRSVAAPAGRAKRMTPKPAAGGVKRIAPARRKAPPAKRMTPKPAAGGVKRITPRPSRVAPTAGKGFSKRPRKKRRSTSAVRFQ